MTATTMALPLRRLGRLELGAELRALQPGTDASGLVVTASVPMPDALGANLEAWEVAWADAAREAASLGADQASADVLTSGAGAAPGGGTRVLVAAHGEVLLARWLATRAAAASVRVGPLPHLLEVAAAAARRPAYVVLLADRHGAEIIAYPGGDRPGERVPVGTRPGEQRDPHPDRPPAQLHGERHVTDREPESGGQRNAEFTAGRVARVAADFGAHIVLGAGDQHILDTVSSHLAATVGPITVIADGPRPNDIDDHLNAAIGTALDQITATAIGAVGDLVSSAAEQPDPGAVRGIAAVAEQLAEQQVAVLLIAADLAADADDGATYRIGSRPTEFVVGDLDGAVEVPLQDGLVWAAVHQDAIVVELPDRGGPLAGQPVAALLRRGAAG
jgi:Bacterial archaeo-eukaryotic release factor family 2